MKVKIEDTKKFKAIMETIASLTDEATFRFENGKLNILEMDPTHVCLVSLKLKLDYKESISRPNGYSVDIDVLNKCLKKSRKDSIELVFAVGDSVSEHGTLNVILGKRMFTIPLIDKEQETLKIPDLMHSFCSKFTLNPKELVEVSLDAGGFDHITFEESNGAFKVSCKDYLQYKKEIPVNRQRLKNGIAKSMFSLDYIKDITKVRGVAHVFDSMSIMLGEDIPAIFEFKDENTELSILLAPRIES